MLLDLIRVVPVAALVGVAPGWFWAKLLWASSDVYERIAYSAALSMALVPAVALIPAQLLGSEVTLAVAVASPLVVLGTGLVAHLRFGPAKVSADPLTTPTVPPSVLALLPIVVAFALVLGADFRNWRLFWLAGSCWGWHWLPCLLSGAVQKFMFPVALLMVAAGIAHRVAPSREPEAREDLPRPAPSERQGSPAVVWGRRLLMPAVLLSVLLRGYLGPALHDWPFIRGVDHYSHAVMTNLMMTRGEIEPYLIYPPGFHTMTELISRLSWLDSLVVFLVL